ncbi:MAG: tetratricopeptide repeat protein [Candidatus Limnocylindrales bacterium]
MIERLLEAERDLAVGLVDRAESIYRALAESDPRNAVAVVGLARCALERGDEHGAYALSVRALEIDPDDAAGLRLEARLSEIFAARGEPVARPAMALPSSAPAASLARAGAPPGEVGPALVESVTDSVADARDGRAAENVAPDGVAGLAPRRGLWRRILGRP